MGIFVGVSKDLTSPAAYFATDFSVDQLAVVGFDGLITASGTVGAKINQGAAVGDDTPTFINFKSSFPESGGLEVNIGDGRPPVLIDSEGSLVSAELAGELTVVDTAALTGVFFFEVDGDKFKILADAALRFGPDRNSPDPMLDARAFGVAVINEHGFAADLDVDLDIGLPVLELDVGARVLINTTNAEQEIQVPGRLVEFLESSANPLSATTLARLDDQNRYSISSVAPDISEPATVNALLDGDSDSVNYTGSSDYVVGVIRGEFDFLDMATGRGTAGIAVGDDLFMLHADLDFNIGVPGIELRFKAQGDLSVSNDGLYLNTTVKLHTNRITSVLELKNLSAGLTIDTRESNDIFILSFEGGLTVAGILTLDGDLKIEVGTGGANTWSIAMGLNGNLGPISTQANGFIQSDGQFDLNVGGNLSFGIPGVFGIDGDVNGKVSLAKSGTNFFHQPGDTYTLTVEVSGGVTLTIIGIPIGASVTLGSSAELGSSTTSFSLDAKGCVDLLGCRSGTVATVTIPGSIFNGPAPVIAGLNEHNHLNLYVGSQKDKRTVGEDRDDEDYVLTDLGDNRVRVEAFGVRHEFTGVTGINNTDFGGGDDSLTLLDWDHFGGTVSGGEGNDELRASGTSAVIFNGGPGNDILVGSAGGDTLNGEEGHDTIDGGSGIDKLSGGSDADVVQGGIGDDTISGTLGDLAGDRITGGLGEDKLVVTGTNDDDAIQIYPDASEVVFRNVDGRQEGLSAAVIISSGSGASAGGGIETVTVMPGNGTNAVVATGNLLADAGVQTLSIDLASNSAEDSVSLYLTNQDDDLTVSDDGTTTTAHWEGGHGVKIKGLESAHDVIKLNLRGGTNDHLAIHGQGSGTLNATTLTGLDIPLTELSYAGVEAMSLDLGSASNELTVATIDAATTVTINNGSGTNTINAGDGTVDGLRGDLIVNGQGGTDTLNINDNSDTGINTGALTNNQITGLGIGNSKSITYSNLEHLNLNLGTSDDTLDVKSTSAGTETHVSTGAGTNTVNVASTAPASDGNVHGVQGHLQITGQGSSDVVNVYDKDNNANSGTLTDSTLTGLGMGTSGITYGGLENLNIELGSRVDTFLVESTASSTLTDIQTGGGGDTVNVEAISGETIVTTGGGANVRVGSTTGNVQPSVTPTDSVLNTIGGLLTLEAFENFPTNSVSITNETGSAETIVKKVTITETPKIGEIWTLVLNGKILANHKVTSGTGTKTEVSKALATLVQNHPGYSTSYQANDAFFKITRAGHEDFSFEVGVGSALRLYDTGNSAGTSDGMMAATELTGFGMAINGGSIQYSGFQDLQVDLGSGNDLVYVESTHQGVTTLLTGNETNATDAKNDQVNVGSIAGYTLIKGGDGNDVIRINFDNQFGDQARQTFESGVAALLDLHGQSGSDFYQIGLAGNAIATINVFDQGGADNGIDDAELLGTDGIDYFLFRGNDTRGMVGLLEVDADGEAIKGGDFERVNYDGNLESLSVNGRDGDDFFVFDETFSPVTVFGGKGDDTFQLGQLFESWRDERNPYNGLAEEDYFETTQVTDGFLSNGVSETATLYGQEGNDNFTVYRNTKEVFLFGGEDDDTFTVRSFVKVDPNDPKAPFTNINGGQGADFIAYTVDAALRISGGDGFDTLTVIGTSFGDDYVVSESGIFGGGKYVTFDTLERVVVDGREGNDRFFITGTSDAVAVEVVGGLGSDTFNIGGNNGIPINVVSNSGEGHSGLISQSVSSSGYSVSGFEGVFVEDLSAKVFDNDEAGVIFQKPEGPLRAFELLDPENEDSPLAVKDVLGWLAVTSYTVALTRAPEEDVRISVVPPRLSKEERDAGARSLAVNTGNTDFREDGVTLTFNRDNWSQPQTVHVKAVNDRVAEGRQKLNIQHKVTEGRSNRDGGAYDQLETLGVTVDLVDDESAEVIVVPLGETDSTSDSKIPDLGSLVSEGAVGDLPSQDYYALVLSRVPGEGGVTVALQTESPDWSLASPNAGVLNVTKSNSAQNFTCTLSRNSNVVFSGQSTGGLVTIDVTGITQMVTDGDSWALEIDGQIYRHVVTDADTDRTVNGVLHSLQNQIQQLLDQAGVNVNQDQVAFGNTDWYKPQIVTLAAEADSAPEGNHYDRIAHSITSSESDFYGVTETDVLRGLKQAIEKDSAEPFEATIDESADTLTMAAGNVPFQVALTGSGLTINTGTAASFFTGEVTLQPDTTPTVGDRWRVQLGPQTFQLVVDASITTTGKLLTALRDTINDDEWLLDSSASGILAITSTDNTSNFTYRLLRDSTVFDSGSSTDGTVTIDASAEPQAVRQAETWSLVLDGQTYRHVVTDATTETVKSVLDSLKERIAASQLGEFTASVTDQSLTISPTGKVSAFSATANVTTSSATVAQTITGTEATGYEDFFTEVTFQLNAPGTLAAGETWTLSPLLELSSLNARPIYSYVVGRNGEKLAVESMDVRITDDDAPGILVLQSNGDTRVVETDDQVLWGTGTVALQPNAVVDATDPSIITFIGEFGLPEINESTEIHDSRIVGSASFAQDLELGKWNNNVDADVQDFSETALPHLTIHGTGDGNVDVYKFNVASTDALVMLDIDRGYEPGDDVIWGSRLFLYDEQGDLIASGPGYSDPYNPSLGGGGSSSWFDDYLEVPLASPGDYYVEVRSWYPTFGGVPDGTTYDLHVSVENHSTESFVFEPQPVYASATQNVLLTDQDFFTFNNEEVGNSDGSTFTIDDTTPYATVTGTGQGDVYKHFSGENSAFDIVAFKISSNMFEPAEVIDRTTLGTAANSGDDTVDPSTFFENVTLQMNGTVKGNDRWTLGLRYVDYTVDVQTDLVDNGLEVSRGNVAAVLLDKVGESPRYTVTHDGAAQVETANVAITASGISTAGNIAVTVTSGRLMGASIDVDVPVASGDDASIIASKIRSQLAANAAVSNYFQVGGSGDGISLTSKMALANDGALNIAISDPDGHGVISAPTSTDTSAGEAIDQFTISDPNGFNLVGANGLEGLTHEASGSANITRSTTAKQSDGTTDTPFTQARLDFTGTGIAGDRVAVTINGMTKWATWRTDRATLLQEIAGQFSLSQITVAAENVAGSDYLLVTTANSATATLGVTISGRSPDLFATISGTPEQSALPNINFMQATVGFTSVVRKDEQVTLTLTSGSDSVTLTPYVATGLELTPAALAQAVLDSNQVALPTHYTLTATTDGLHVQSATPFSIAFTATPSGTAQVNQSPSLIARRISLAGIQASDGDSLRILLGDQESVSQTLDQSNSARDELSELAVLLAADINAKADYHSTAVGEYVFVTRAGTPFTPTVELVRGGQVSASTADALNLSLIGLGRAGSRYRLNVHGTELTTAGTGLNSAQLTQELSTLVNNNTSFDVAAIAKDSSLILASGTHVPFQASLREERSEAVSLGDLTDSPPSSPTVRQGKVEIVDIPQIGQIWTPRLNDIALANIEITSVNASKSGIASVLAQLVKGQAGYSQTNHANEHDAFFTIKYDASTLEDFTFTVTTIQEVIAPTSSTTAAVRFTIADGLTPEEGNQWITRIGNGAPLPPYSVPSGLVTANDVRIGLLNAIEGDPGTDYQGVTKGNQVFVTVNGNSPLTAVDAEVVRPLTTDRVKDAAVSTLTLAGTPNDGDTWKITVDGHTPTVSPNSGGLSIDALITNWVNDVFTDSHLLAAIATGSSLQFIKVDSHAPSASLTVEPASNFIQGSISGELKPNWIQEIQLESAGSNFDEVTVGEVWEVQIPGITDTAGATNGQVIATSTDITAIASLVQGELSLAYGSNALVTTSGKTIRIVRQDGLVDTVAPVNQTRVLAKADGTGAGVVANVQMDATFYQSVTFSFQQGAPVTAGEPWTLTLDGQKFSYIVQGTDADLRDIAAGLKASVEDQSEFSVTLSEGTDPTNLTIAHNSHGTVPYPFVLEGSREGSVHGAFDIDSSITAEGSLGNQVQFSYAATPTLELFDSEPSDGPSTGLLRSSINVASGKPELNDAVDSGSILATDPFLEYTFTKSDLGGKTEETFYLRVGSHAEFSERGLPLASINGGLISDQNYELLVSLQNHPKNSHEEELFDKTLLITEGPLAGQSGTITSYNVEAKTFTVNVADHVWNSDSLAAHRFEIYDNAVQQPKTDSYEVVLTAAPSGHSNVIIDVTPEFTRTYNADLAFDESQNNGEHNDKQVRVATTRAVIAIDKAPSVTESWEVLLSAGVEDDSWSNQTDPTTVFAGSDRRVIATDLATKINAKYGFTAVAVDSTVVITSDEAFYADIAISAANAKLISQGKYEATSDTLEDGRSEVVFELGGTPRSQEVWSLGINETQYQWTVRYGDSPAMIAREIAALIPPESYDVTVYGSTITVRGGGPGETFTASFMITPGTDSKVSVTPQLVFSGDNWSTKQTVTVMAIDDHYIDGGDALVLPAAEQRANVIRGPLTIEGGQLLGAEVFFNDPLLLPREINRKITDGTISSAPQLDSAGQLVVADEYASHLNALTGLRPGFDPRMSEFLFYVSFLDGVADGKQLTVAQDGVSNDILSFANTEPFAVEITQNAIPPTADVRFFGKQAASHQDARNLVTWREALLTLNGSVEAGEQLHVRLDGHDLAVTADAAATPLTALKLAEVIEGRGYETEFRIGLQGESNLWVKKTDATGFTMQFSATSDSKVDHSISGFTQVLPTFGESWLTGSFYFNDVGAEGDVWKLIIRSSDGSTSDSTAQATVNAAGVLGLTSTLADAIGSNYQPLVSGTQVTFRSGYPIDEDENELRPAAGDAYFYGPLNPNLFVEEVQQVDLVNVYNADSPARESVTLRSDHIGGLGMGEASIIGGRTLRGGITYYRIEDLNLALGSGDNLVNIESTHAGATTISSQQGTDTYHIESVLGNTVIDASYVDPQQIGLVNKANTFNVGVANQQIDEIASLLTIQGSGNDILNVIDSSDENANTGLLTDTTLTGLDMPTLPEVQTLFVRASGGSFVIKVGDDSTVETIPYGAEASELKTALANLYGVVESELRVTRVASYGSYTYTFAFVGDAAGIDFPELQHVQPVQQVESITVTSGASNPGTASVTLNSKRLTGGSLTISASLTGGEDATTVAAKIREAFDSKSEIVANFLVGGTGAEITLKSIAALSNDDTLKIAIVGGATGVVSTLSENQAAGIVGMTSVPNESVDLRINTVRNGATVNDTAIVQTLTVDPNTTAMFGITLLDKTTSTINADASAAELFAALSPILNPNNPIPDPALLKKFGGANLSSAFDPSLTTAPGEPTESAFPFTNNLAVYKHENVFHIRFQGEHEDLMIAPENVTTIPLAGSEDLSGGVVLAQRPDGINYYGIGHLNIYLGDAQSDLSDEQNNARNGNIFNIRSTHPSTQTKLVTGAGDDQITVSSTATDYSWDTDSQTLNGSVVHFNGSMPVTLPFEFLQMVPSDVLIEIFYENDTETPVRSFSQSISDLVQLNTATGAYSTIWDGKDNFGNVLAPGAYSWVATGETVSGPITASVPLRGKLDGVLGSLDIEAGPGTNTLLISDVGSKVGDNVEVSKSRIRGLAPVDIHYRASGGTYADGVFLWSGFGDDYVDVISTRWDSATWLYTGLGDDNVIARLDMTNGFFAADGQGPLDHDYLGEEYSDDDTIDGSLSSLPLYLQGGQGSDHITGGSAGDIIFGDRGDLQLIST
ncbi:MAG: hypothetical protein ACPGLY_26425, partial [Rubripirellula sp.]